MKPMTCILLLAIFAACSPYKKITLTANDRLTQKWQGAAETAVNAAYGAYKEKRSIIDGYILSFDYSYSLPIPYQKSSGYQVSLSQQSPINETTNSTIPSNNQQANNNLVLRRIDFYFDKTNHVGHVEALGFPDSVYYIKRK